MKAPLNTRLRTIFKKPPGPASHGTGPIHYPKLPGKTEGLIRSAAFDLKISTFLTLHGLQELRLLKLPIPPSCQRIFRDIQLRGIITQSNATEPTKWKQAHPSLQKAKPWVFLTAGRSRQTLRLSRPLLCWAFPAGEEGWHSTVAATPEPSLVGTQTPVCSNSYFFWQAIVSS